MNLKPGDKVNLLIERETPLGFTVLIENEFEGLVYHDDVFIELEEGMEGIGFIKNIREDGKIDVTLRPQGYVNVIETDSETILETLRESPSGAIMITDKSSPDQIRHEFNMSKKSFKKAVGNLYKHKLINILDDRIELLVKQ
ncbi:S1 RNA-binding domain-containing protein [Nonlabens agnitus]|uniref:DNA-binding protein n=1 Tax=Nonlabens agnitus TaxID=870484 RepID=A0A2S9WT50_9FLAO|nr:DNA-binding protein [Nonlabens agnitus]PRP66665.1 DNA-binding protein [Nonlabens agnitus]